MGKVLPLNTTALFRFYKQTTMSSISSTPPSLNSDSVATNRALSLLNVQEQTSLTSELSSIGTASAHSHPTVSTAAVASFQSGIGAQSTMVPVGSFYSTLHNTGRAHVALLLGNDIMNVIEANVDYAARSTIIARAAENVQTMFDEIATHVQILLSQIENWQRVHIGSNDNSFVAIDNQILGMAINEAIERLENPN